MPTDLSDSDRIGLIREVLEKVHESTESWEFQGIGMQLAYLVQAIVERSVEKACVELDDAPGGLRSILKGVFPPSHRVWFYVDPIGDSPQVRFEISEDRSRLVLWVDEGDRGLLCRWRAGAEEWGTVFVECEVLGHLLANSDLQWVFPSDTGDMTDAPLLGIVGGDDTATRTKEGPHGAYCSGGDERGPFYQPILERWGYPNYALRSFVDDLCDEGRAVFINQW